MPVRGGLVRQPLGRAPAAAVAPGADPRRHGRSAWSPCWSPRATWRAAVIGTFIAAVIGLSLVVVTGYAGQVSLAQLALAGTAAFTPELPHPELGRAVPDRPAPGRAGRDRASACVVGLPALRLRGLTLGVVTLALAYAIEAVWFRNTDIVRAPAAPGSTPPSLFGIDLGIGAGQAFPRIEFGLAVPGHAGRGRRRRRLPAPQRAGLGDARRAGQRALGRRRRRQRRAGEGASASPSPRSSPASAAACSPTAAAWSPSTRSPRSAASPCCRPPTWPASRRCGAASSPASWPAPASCSSPSTAGSTSASGSRSSAASC